MTLLQTQLHDINLLQMQMMIVEIEEMQQMFEQHFQVIEHISRIMIN